MILFFAYLAFAITAVFIVALVLDFWGD